MLLSHLCLDHEGRPSVPLAERGGLHTISAVNTARTYRIMAKCKLRQFKFNFLTLTIYRKTLFYKCLNIIIPHGEDNTLISGLERGLASKRATSTAEGVSFRTVAT